MPRPPLTEAAMALLAQPNPAVIAVVRPDGQPVSVATLVPGRRGRPDSSEHGQRPKAQRPHAPQPRVSLTALKDGAWYTHISVQGRITQGRDDPDFVDIDRLSRHYGKGPDDRFD